VTIFLGTDHGQRVAGYLDGAAEQPRQGDHAWRWPDGISDVDVHVQVESCGRECRREGDPDAAVLVLIPDGFYGGTISIEDQPVVGRGGRDLAHQPQDVFALVGHLLGLHVDVSGGAARVVGGQEDTALEYETWSMSGGPESGQEALQCVELVQFVRRAALLACEVL
jgi:hypothetical protein